MFSLYQQGHLEGYVQEFTRVSFCVAHLDDRSRALLFMRGLEPSVRIETLRRNAGTLIDAISTARTISWLHGWSYQQSQRPPVDRHTTRRTRRPPNPSFSQVHAPRTPRERLDDDLRRELSKEGKCFKCRQTGHLARFCPEHEHASPNAGHQWSPGRRHWLNETRPVSPHHYR